MSFPTTSWPVEGVDIAIGFCGLVSTPTEVFDPYPNLNIVANSPLLTSYYISFLLVIRCYKLYVISAREIPIWGFPFIIGTYWYPKSSNSFFSMFVLKPMVTWAITILGNSVKHEVMVTHGACCEVYTCDLVWMEWPQVQQCPGTMAKT